MGALQLGKGVVIGTTTIFGISTGMASTSIEAGTGGVNIGTSGGTKTIGCGTTADIVVINSTEDASSTTGGLRVAGGGGIASKLYVADTITTASTIEATGTATAAESNNDTHLANLSQVKHLNTAVFASTPLTISISWAGTNTLSLLSINLPQGKYLVMYDANLQNTVDISGKIGLCETDGDLTTSVDGSTQVFKFNTTYIWPEVNISSTFPLEVTSETTYYLCAEPDVDAGMDTAIVGVSPDPDMTCHIVALRTA